MLKRLTKKDFDLYLNEMYALALDFTNSCYPTFADGIKTKADFIKMLEKGLYKDTCPAFEFFYNEEMLGWIQLEVDINNSYVQLICFNVANHKELAVKEVMSWLEKDFKGFEICFGCSSKNEIGGYFLNYSFHLVEELYQYKINLQEYNIVKLPSLVCRVTKKNYQEFCALHSLYDSEMYWNCERIFENFSQWEIYLYYENSIPIATIYTHINQDLSEIYGIDFLNQAYSESVLEALILATLCSCKSYKVSHLMCLCEEKEKTIFNKLGFKFIDKYQCYIKRKE